MSSTSAAGARAARKDMARVERQLDRLRQTEAELHAELAARASDHAAALELAARLREVESRIGVLEDAWLDAAEAAD